MSTPRRDTGRRDTRRDDTGSVLLLVIGFVLVAALTVVTVVDASAAFLQRRQLAAWADTAALAGAQGIDIDAYYARGASVATSLDPATVARRVRAHLAVAPDGTRIEQLSSDGQQVGVVLSAPLRLPFLGGVAARVGLTQLVVVEARAQLAYRATTTEAGPPG